jgi:uncharacterized protein involved in exopolysaccharide biosynthesis
MDAENQEQQKPIIETATDFILKIKPYVKILWENRKRLIIFNGIVCVSALLYVLLLVEPYYESTISILPDFGNKGSDMLSQYAGLAAMVGVNVGDDISTLVYQSLLSSEPVLYDVIYKKYNTKKFNHPVDLTEYFEMDPDKSLPDSLQKREMFLALYNGFGKGLASIDYDVKTKIINVTVEMPESQLSADVANALVWSLNKYLLTQRKSFATEQKRYLVARVQQVSDTLAICENALKKFREANRQIGQSPELMLVQSRLERNVEIQQAIFIELTKQLELAKLGEVKDVPVINVVEQVKDPIKKSGPKRRTALIEIFLLSFTGSAGWFLSREKIKSALNRIKQGYR